uniref:Uncharacterized protein n=1 Tax=Spongospora subterranea TaxID=70186 RepID=A0A0H5QS01_9EUKA|eukprot:CRZ04326.1 hypothetical protein [Spongospora subterranea]
MSILDGVCLVLESHCKYKDSAQKTFVANCNMTTDFLEMEFTILQKRLNSPSGPKLDVNFSKTSDADFDSVLINNLIIETAIAGDHDMLARLLSHPAADLDSGWAGLSHSPFWTADHRQAAFRGAAGYGRVACVELLLGHPDVDPTAVDNEAIRESCANGHGDTST